MATQRNRDGTQRNRDGTQRNGGTPRNREGTQRAPEGALPNLGRRTPPARSTRPLAPVPGGAPRSARLGDPLISLVAARFSATPGQRLARLLRDGADRLEPLLHARRRTAKAPTSFMADYWTPDTRWNEHARRVLALVNGVRARHGLAPVKQHFELWYLAAESSNDMAFHQYLAHTDRTGRDAERRFRDEAIRFGVGGENIACGQTHADEVMQDWMSSPSHRTNILDPAFRFAGVGIGQDRYGRLFWTLALSG